MCEKFFISAAAVLCLVFLLFAEASTCLGDAGAMIEEARGLVEAGKHSEARAALQSVIQTYPDKEEAIWAQSDLARMELKLKNDSAAEAVIANLKTVYADNAFTAHALHDIAFKYHAMKRFEDARELYQYIVDKFPGNEYEIWALGGLATSSLKLGDTAAGNAAASRLITNFAGHKDMAILAHDVATGYVERKNYSMAKGFFSLALSSNPDAEHKMWSLIGLAKVKIRLGEYAEVQPMVDKLISEFQSDQRLLNELNEIAKFFKRASRNEDSALVYGKTFSHFPSSEYPSEARLDAARGYIRSLAESGDDAKAGQAISTLIANSQGSAGLAAALDNIALRYDQLGKFEAAKGVYQQIIDKCPGDSLYVTKARMVIEMVGVLPLVESGQHAAVDAEVGRLATQFKDHPDFARNLSRIIGEQCYMKGLSLEGGGDMAGGRVYLEKAVGIWEKVINEHPDSAAAPGACCWAGNCCERLGQYDKALRFYKKVVDSHPEYEKAWYALFMVGKLPGRLGAKGELSKAEADAATRVAYEKLLELYPKCKAAAAASSWLESKSAQRGGAQ